MARGDKAPAAESPVASSEETRAKTAMKLVPNWQVVLRHAWSVRLILIAGLLTGIEAVLPLVPDLWDIPRGVLASLTFLVVMGALVARFIAQQTVSGDP